MQITNCLTIITEDRDYNVSCWSRLRMYVCTYMPQCQHRLLVLESAYSWRFLASQEEAKQAGKSTEGSGRSTPLYSFRRPSSRLRIVHAFLSFARTRGGGELVLARQNLTKQFAPKQTTASGLLVNKQHIYFQRLHARSSFARTTAFASASASICRRYI